MHIIYPAFVRLPTPRAHGLQIMKMCESFSRTGASVRLVAPSKYPTSNDERDPFKYYNVRHIFSVVRIFGLDFLGYSTHWSKLSYWVDFSSFLISLAFVRVSPGEIVYVRDPLLFLPFRKRQYLVAEIHDIPLRATLFYRMLRKASRIIVLTSYLKEDLVARGFKASQIIVAPDGVDLRDFENMPSKVDARKELNLSKGKKIVLYTGHLYEWKGADILARVAALIPGAQFIFVGGIGAELDAFRNSYANASNITIISMQPHSRIPTFLAAADLLVLPNSGKERISARYTSPLKLFEYMAAGRTIVASDLPSIREVLDEKMAFFANPDDEQSLASVIRIALQQSDTGTHAQNSRNEVRQYTWDRRAARIREAIAL
jgi:glycosyltransferase involved in cell wall biosynthesis